MAVMRLLPYLVNCTRSVDVLVSIASLRQVATNGTLYVYKNVTLYCLTPRGGEPVIVTGPGMPLCTQLTHALLIPKRIN